MFEDHNSAIYEIFTNSDLISPAQLREFVDTQNTTSKSLADVILESEAISRESFMKAVAQYLGYEYSDDVPEKIPEEIIGLLESNKAHMYGVVPLKAQGGSVFLAAVDPFNYSIIDDLSFALNRDVSLVVMDPSIVESLISDYYGEESSYISFLDEIASSFSGMEGDVGDKKLNEAANLTPIIRFVDIVLQQAVKDGASDVHFEPYEDKFRLRYRIDGSLYEMAPPPKNMALPIVSRIKVLSNMNIAENRIPQDGRIKTTISGKAVDLRVSTLPTQFGESVVLRVLDKSAVNLDLDKLSMSDDVLTNIRSVVNRPNGIFIVTGPTGSGKTTTLYSALREVNTIDMKILTAEDPIEYEIEGIMQVGVNHQVGLTFAAALRSFLRQDPDTIMVGEIRDLETAQIAVQASLTGHIVLSTLHTNDAPGAITRLIDMGLEPFLISASLEAILAQRLLRRICKRCRTAYIPDQKIIEMLGADALEIADKQFYFGKGCHECSRTGYRGRQGLFEMIMMTDGLRDLINRKAPTLVIKQKAIEQGMRTLRDDGLRAIFDGATTIEEVLKYT